MKQQTILILILIVLVFLAGLFLWNRSRSVGLDGEPISPVLVDIITPANGTTISKGETLSILAQAWSPNPITEMELWEDGNFISSESVQGQDNPVNYFWDLDPTELGVHAYFVRAADSEGEVGQSQTLILNIAGGGFQQISAGAGDTLSSMAGQNGFAVDELVSLNPGLNSPQPLGDGQPVILPPSGENGGIQNVHDVPGVPDLVIHWQFTPTSAVANSYCYQSVGGESWHRVPDLPFSFLPGDEWIQTPFFELTLDHLDLLLECWGWNGGELVYLGEGQASLDFAHIPNELSIAGSGFEATGFPEMKPLSSHGPDESQIPPPYALREAETVFECASHYGGNFWANSICDELLNASTKQYYVFVWEWSPGVCWGPCPWGDSIDGYLIYEMDPSLQSGALLKKIPNGNQKVTAVPLPWGGKCYAVRAYAETLAQGTVISDASIYCGEQPEPKTMKLKPQDWLSTDGVWIQEGCETYGDAPYFIPGEHQLSIGVFIVNNDDCFKQGDSAAAVKFNLATVGPSFGMEIQQAILHVTQINIAYSVDSEVAIGAKPFLCATRVGKAKADWAGLSSGHFIDGENYLIHKEYFPSSTSGLGGGFGKDVTSTVLGWIDNPSTNHGFIMSADWGDLYNQGWLSPGWDKGTCYSLVNVELELRYFTSN